MLRPRGMDEIMAVCSCNGRKIAVFVDASLGCRAWNQAPVFLNLLLLLSGCVHVTLLLFLVLPFLLSCCSPVAPLLLSRYSRRSPVKHVAVFLMLLLSISCCSPTAVTLLLLLPCFSCWACYSPAVLITLWPLSGYSPVAPVVLLLQALLLDPATVILAAVIPSQFPCYTVRLPPLRPFCIPTRPVPERSQTPHHHRHPPNLTHGTAVPLPRGRSPLGPAQLGCSQGSIGWHLGALSFASLIPCIACLIGEKLAAPCLGVGSPLTGNLQATLPFVAVVFIMSNSAACVTYCVSGTV
ncbi:hypothetical protein BaRGS_00030643 [Batillaria attramentaria]|uniref:Uncharacterized protein n=1 Tax=Batillaria attramentaria TaxID=370345 RepID=A0ABD0JUB6_9CAEN